MSGSKYQAELRRALLNAVGPEDISDLAKQLLADAQNGEVAAAKLVLEHVLGKAPRESVRIDLPEVRDERTALEAQAAILAAAARGELSVEAAARLSDIARNSAEASVWLDLAERIERQQRLGSWGGA